MKVPVGRLFGRPATAINAFVLTSVRFTIEPCGRARVGRQPHRTGMAQAAPEAGPHFAELLPEARLLVTQEERMGIESAVEIDGMAFPIVAGKRCSPRIAHQPQRGRRWRGDGNPCLQRRLLNRHLRNCCAKPRFPCPECAARFDTPRNVRRGSRRPLAPTSANVIGKAHGTPALDHNQVVIVLEEQ